MNPINIECLNSLDIVRRSEPVTVGVPLVQGGAAASAQFTLRDPAGDLIPVQTKALNYWPDRSIKWLLCDFLADVAAGGTSSYQLDLSPQLTLGVTVCTIEQNADFWRVGTGTLNFDIDTRVLRPFKGICSVDKNVSVCQDAEVKVIDFDGRPWRSQVRAIEIETTGPVRTTILLQGQFSGLDGRSLLFESRLNFFTGTSRTVIELRLHNADAARHPGNLWDLGDPASIILKQWSLKLPVVQNIVSRKIQPTIAGEIFDLSVTGGSIYQEASGGKNWRSPVHRNRFGDVPMKQSGWLLQADCQERIGDRAQPLLQIKTDTGQVSASIDNFWQRFPKKLGLDNSIIEFDFLPGDFPSGHELQGGEQITEIVRIDFSADQASDGWTSPDIVVRCDLKHYQDTKVVPEGLWQPSDARYKDLLDTGLNKQKGFKAKSEQIDEYGWRNFGELYADHESAFSQGCNTFVSHYNNQYDPLYSFYRLFLTTEDPAWRELAHDLAAHIADIDINHTDEDREEYCHGPFWHTDHYLDAGLSTHRMASREHLQYKNPVFCGGGPGAEHCYSGGLALHHLVSGDPRSKQLVKDLAEWCWLSLHGPQTVGAALLRAVKNFKRLRNSKKTLWPRYPFTRGTGNCLNTLLDAYELTGDEVYLAKAVKLIKGTVHPSDDPAERDLANVELYWSYTVFLSALGRFLAVKELWKQQDNDFNYGRASLLAYARWMADNEYPYLDKPEILEFPNETWAAQELRKGCVFNYAAKYAEGGESKQFQGKAKYFLDYGLDELSRQQTSYYTRPLVLLLQNGWAVEALSQQRGKTSFAQLPQFIGRSITRRTLSVFLHRFAGDMNMVLRHTSLKRELRWLKSRLRKN